VWRAAAADDSELCERRVPGGCGLTQRVGRPHATAAAASLDRKE